MSEPIQTKKCPQSKQIKIAQRQKQYRQKNKVKFQQSNKQYYQNHKEEKKQYSKLYYEKNKADKNKQNKKYRNTLKGYMKNLFKNMLCRCNSPKYHCYSRYGERGIKVKFTRFEDFFNYVVKELKVDPRGLTIDRINNAGHYEKGNIRFVTIAENCRNRSKH